MSGDALTGAGLIAAAQAAQAALDKGAPPSASSEARFVAAMIARARKVGARDQALAPAIAAQEAAIVDLFGARRDLEAVAAAIRSGTFDGNNALHQALCRLAVLRLRATKPEALAPESQA